MRDYMGIIDGLHKEYKGVISGYVDEWKQNSN